MGKNGGNSGSSEFKLFGRMIPLDVNECDGGQGENVVLEGDQEKASKRPSKIVPCPRCDSMDTKFCYFNNYNVNQPRHYCRKCQRYWTAGGSLRNVPIGAGRRKNKPCFGTQNGWNDGQTPIPCYKFAKDEPIYQDMGSFCETLKGAEVAQKEGKPRPQSQIDDFSDSCALNLSGQNLVKEVFVGSGKNVMFLELAEKSTHLTKGIDSGEKPSCSSSDNKTQMSTTATKAESSEVADDVACDSEKMSSTPESEPLIMSPHGQMYCWRSMPSGISGAQWCSPGTGLSPPINWPMWAQLCSVPWKPSYSCSEPKGVLGKRERDEGEIESKSGRSSSLWVPKTLRINDPGEALTSSFVENLEIESKPGSISSGGMFKAFQPKIAEVDKILCADPATHSLSASVVESS